MYIFLSERRNMRTKQTNSASGRYLDLLDTVTPPARQAEAVPDPASPPALSDHSGRVHLPDTLDASPESIPDDAPLAVDVETIGPDNRLPVPWAPGCRLVCVGFAAAGKRWAYPAEDRTSIQSWLSSPHPKVMHNAGYDLAWLCSAGFKVAATIHDTAWVLSFQDGVAARGLKVRGAYEYAVHLPKNTTNPELVLAYSGNDCLNTLSLFDPRSPWLDHRLYSLYRRTLPRLVDVSLRGLPVFRDRFDARLQDAETELADLTDRLRSLAPVNWRSTVQVARVFDGTLPTTRTPKGRQSVADPVLRHCRHAAAPLLLAHRAVTKLLGTYLRPHRGADLVHGLLSLGGAWTGRTSSRGVNLQNIPRSLRSLFGVSGFDWVKLDFSAAELVVVATITGCAPLLEAFAAGRDPHRETAARIFRVSPDAVDTQQRAIGKTLNFGLTYGGSAAIVLRQAELAGIPLTLDDARRFRTAWFRAYPEIWAWQEQTTATLARGGIIKSAFGRQWAFPAGSQAHRNRALAAPISSTSSDLLLLGADQVWERLERQGVVTNLVHDELDVLIPAGSFDPAAWREIALAIASVDPRFPMTVEVSVGPSWGETVPQITARSPPSHSSATRSSVFDRPKGDGAAMPWKRGKPPGGFFKFQPQQTITGTLLEPKTLPNRSGGETVRYRFEIIQPEELAGVVILPDHVDLVGWLRQYQPGDYLRIKQLGSTPTSNGTMYQYEVHQFVRNGGKKPDQKRPKTSASPEAADDDQNDAEAAVPF
jgi:DNA polymerase I-like protein with 3'-5' exonuclease and polymerase domains